ncbi:hypothetical protein OIN60_20700 [Paenibacillus sp. P96]|uniref:Integron-associated effector binding protein domain-containing protein n=1 Tax=Paenibacillus zeirhizosphaerae TaxID=2987519 RepID=A0ABT9FWP2_9BACL|nr:hypothetical protein [Paenibacillus sp. P96]MDP4099143.1 hypothetical protein [Paenibacillus sp. P96]
MKILDIIPGKSIGKVELGMNRADAERLSDDVWYKNEYDEDGLVNYIQIGYGTKDEYNCQYNGIDLFNTKADDLVALLDKISPYDRSHSELGYTYAFPELGLTLWRSSIFTEEMRNEEWFKEMSKENQEDEMKYLYFESIAVFKVEH